MPYRIITIDEVLKNARFAPDPQRVKLVREAYEFARIAHEGQKRKSGEDYIQHPLHAALHLARIGMGSKTISAALLHDVPEDTNFTLAEIAKKFDNEIATLVDGVTKLGKIRLRGTKEEIFLENLRKMFLAMAADIRVVIIKLADRLHNMETLDALPTDKKLRIAMETMEVFVPLANRLGIGEIKVRLEDLAFKYLDPENYEKVTKILEKEAVERQKYVNKVVDELKRELHQEGVEVLDIFGRTKHIHSLFQKLQRHEMDINKVYDLTGIRIIVPEVVNCYETLGIVHRKYHPLVGRIKDYISLPKPNGYQSIHTTIFGPEGKFLEIQIRTKKMNEEAEFGIAAHWVYTEKKRWLRGWIFRSQPIKIPQKDLTWVRQLREWQQELGRDNQEFVESLKIDFFKNHIFAFTPNGDIIDLPEESTPVDFAYKVHSEIGNRTASAKVNGKIVPLDYHVRNGDVVEIITTKDPKNPSRDWLKFVKTSEAKSHIRKFMKREGIL
ncbi:MAG TPA: RelA/SpoT family protein [Patescibacteria group bacterium]|nr:RelA/SpoT family protein [Patescibacteria group bacterium]